MVDFFTPEASRNYDRKNSGLAPITDNLHFLIRLVLKDLPAQARVLCVGVGTGAEILSLAAHYPGWTFVGGDPSAAMLDVCRERLAAAGVAERCTLVHGYVHDVLAAADFDACLNILVAHFINRDDRLGFFRNMTAHLKPGGMLVNAEISYDLSAPEFPAMLENWKQVQALMGATPESLTALPALLREKLTVLPQGETENLMRAGGIPLPVRFFQAFMVTGWYGRKAP